MEGTDFIVLAIVGAVTFYAGFQTGRLSASKGASQGRGDAPTPISLPELPDTGTQASPSVTPRPRSSAPPPASAGGMVERTGSSPAEPSRSAPPRRSSTPPPAAAGLVDKGQGGKSRGS